LFGLLFDPKDECDTFLRNFGLFRRFGGKKTKTCFHTVYPSPRLKLFWSYNYFDGFPEDVGSVRIGARYGFTFTGVDAVFYLGEVFGYG
jgi:hypothetical protein